MLSAGVDSMLVAAVLRSMGRDLTGVTIGGWGGVGDDLPGASAMAEHLNIPLTTINPRSCASSAGEVARDLDSSDIWDVAAALPLRAVRMMLDEAEAERETLIFTGQGADLVMAGGAVSPLTVEELAASRREGLKYRGEDAYPIPDFLPRVLGPRAPYYVKAYLSESVIAATEPLAPSDLWVEIAGITYDKAVARHALSEMTGRGDLAWTPKRPLQASSGVFEALYARAVAMAKQRSAGWSEPSTDDPQMVASRLYLELARKAEVATTP